MKITINYASTEAMTVIDALKATVDMYDGFGMDIDKIHAELNDVFDKIVDGTWDSCMDIRSARRLLHCQKHTPPTMAAAANNPQRIQRVFFFMAASPFDEKIKQPQYTIKSAGCKSGSAL